MFLFFSTDKQGRNLRLIGTHIPFVQMFSAEVEVIS